MPEPRKTNRGLRDKFDQWFPTIVKYTGWGLAIYGALIDRGQNPALLPAATAMILFKTIYGSGGRE